MNWSAAAFILPRRKTSAILCHVSSKHAAGPEKSCSITLKVRRDAPSFPLGSCWKRRTTCGWQASFSPGLIYLSCWVRRLSLDFALCDRISTSKGRDFEIFYAPEQRASSCLRRRDGQTVLGFSTQTVSWPYCTASWLLESGWTSRLGECSELLGSFNIRWSHATGLVWPSHACYVSLRTSSNRPPA